MPMIFGSNRKRDKQDFNKNKNLSADLARGIIV